MHSFNPSVSWINTEVGYSINHRLKTKKSAVMQIFDLGMNRRGGVSEGWIINHICVRCICRGCVNVACSGLPLHLFAAVSYVTFALLLYATGKKHRCSIFFLSNSLSHSTECKGKCFEDSFRSCPQHENHNDTFSIEISHQYEICNSPVMKFKLQRIYVWDLRTEKTWITMTDLPRGKQLC